MGGMLSSHRCHVSPDATAALEPYTRAVGTDLLSAASSTWLFGF